MRLCIKEDMSLIYDIFWVKLQVFKVSFCTYVQSWFEWISPHLIEIKGLLHGYEWRLRFGALELRFG